MFYKSMKCRVSTVLKIKKRLLDVCSFFQSFNTSFNWFVLVIRINKYDVSVLSVHIIIKYVLCALCLQVTHYRFSVAWTRILPDGTTNIVNSKGIVSYHWKKWFGKPLPNLGVFFLCNRSCYSWMFWSFVSFFVPLCGEYSVGPLCPQQRQYYQSHARNPYPSDLKPNALPAEQFGQILQNWRVTYRLS